MSKRAVWSVTIALAGFSYIVVALWLNIQIPVFAALFVLAAGYEVIESHAARRKPWSSAKFGKSSAQRGQRIDACGAAAGQIGGREPHHNVQRGHAPEYCRVD
jgi:hypothetical protein